MPVDYDSLASEFGGSAVEAAEPTQEWDPNADPYGMGIVPGMSQEERDAAMLEGYATGARESAPIAASAAMLPLSAATGARMLPFLARLGATPRAAGAGAGAAGSIPYAIPQALEGNLTGAAKTVGMGAAWGFAAPGSLGPGRAAVPTVAAPIAAAAAPAVVAPITAAAAPAVAAAAPAAAPAVIRQLMQAAKESGAKAGEKVWFLLKDGLPVKVLTPSAAAAAKRSGQATTWVKAL